MNRILIIRGGAIGDFILTLPALRAVREAYPNAYIELLAYQRIAALVEEKFYVNAVRSIDYAPLSRFFAKGADFKDELQAHFASFDLLISYLYDPDRIFETNLRRAGAGKILVGPGKLDGTRHAVDQLVKPLAKLDIPVDDLRPKLFLSESDRRFAKQFRRDCSSPMVALHPGSGSQRKNWPLRKWVELGDTLLRSGFWLLILSGEADVTELGQLKDEWNNQPVQFAHALPLIEVAALLENCLFVGHDTGISHLAAAVAAQCVLLFGPTDPAIWAPRNNKVSVVRAPNDDLAKLDVATVLDALQALPGLSRNK